MDNVTVIRVVAGVLFVVVFYVLIIRRKKKTKMR
jgi:preprotein translocase subunit YajC